MMPAIERGADLDEWTFRRFNLAVVDVIRFSPNILLTFTCSYAVDAVDAC